MKILEQDIPLCGLQTELSKSQTQNYELIQNLWKTFNNELKKNNLNQNNINWEKYGITFQTNDQYFYLAAIPKLNQIFPQHFTTVKIPKGNYQLFIHKGKMENIKQTIFEIYKVILPKMKFEIQDHKKIGFVHFEKYDYRFQWNHPNSIIEIYLPLNNK
ncbi:GyrI-like domain-containing protein [Flavobacterium sp.]|uniref:GyrI-like domain-containing protein n=1 Tax=Flavobacterium sp. TaxID=239 RepID=UPI003C4DC14A